MGMGLEGEAVVNVVNIADLGDYGEDDVVRGDGKVVYYGEDGRCQPDGVEECAVGGDTVADVRSAVAFNFVAK